MLLDSVKSMHGEDILREYSFPSAGCSFQQLSVKKKMFGQRGTASVCITNKRLVCGYERPGLFSTADKAVYQMNIKDVGDICISAARQSMKGPIALIVLGVVMLFLITIFIAAFGDGGNFSALIIGFIIIAGGVVWAFLRGPIKALDVRSKGGSGAEGAGLILLARRRVMAGITGFDEMSGEIGAIVSDLKEYGDECVTFWKP